MLRFDPLREIDRLTQETRSRARSVLAFDAVRDDDQVTIYFDVPGIDGEDIELQVERNELTVTVTRMWRGDDQETLVSERPQGTFTRRVLLSDALDADRLEAGLSDGVLRVTVPVSERSKPRKIDVSTGANQGEEIEVSGSDG